MTLYGQKYIVTGGAGFIGSHVVTHLLEQGNRVVVLDNLSTGFDHYLPNDPNLTFLNVDISDWTELSKNFAYFKDAAGVFHLAAVARIQPSIFAPHLTHESNVTGTFNILEMMRASDVRCIVYSASSSCYGLKTNENPSLETDPIDCQTPYAITKYMGEMYCDTWAKLHGIVSARLRYFNVWGPRSPTTGPYAPVISKFFKQAMRGSESEMTVVGDGLQKRDFTYVNDVVRANLAAMDWLHSTGAPVSEVFNIGTGVNHSILSVAEKIQLMYPHTPISHVSERIGEAKTSLADNSKAKRVLGWEPRVTLNQGLTWLNLFYKNENL